MLVHDLFEKMMETAQRYVVAYATETFPELESRLVEL